MKAVGIVHVTIIKDANPKAVCTNEANDFHNSIPSRRQQQASILHAIHHPLLKNGDLDDPGQLVGTTLLALLLLAILEVAAVLLPTLCLRLLPSIWT